VAGDRQFHLGSSANTAVLQWGVQGNYSAYPNNKFHPPDIGKNTTYRLEIRIARLDATTYNVHLRLYDGSDNLLYDDDDWQNAAESDTLAATPTITYQDVDESKAISLGWNGPFQGKSVEGDHPFNVLYFGAVMVRTDDWCGAYDSGEASF